MVLIGKRWKWWVLSFSPESSFGKEKSQSRGEMEKRATRELRKDKRRRSSFLFSFLFLSYYFFFFSDNWLPSYVKLTIGELFLEVDFRCDEGNRQDEKKWAKVSHFWTPERRESVRRRRSLRNDLPDNVSTTDVVGKFSIRWDRQMESADWRERLNQLAPTTLERS